MSAVSRVLPRALVARLDPRLGYYLGTWRSSRRV